MTGQPGRPGEDSYRVDFTTGTGERTRHERLSALDTTEYYPDWQGRDARMLSYTSAPLDAPAEIAGHPVVDLWITADQGDAVLHVYLSEVEADGTVRYVTEGVLRALHRREAEPPRNQRWTWPYRDFTRASAEPLVPGRPARLRFALLPTSWAFSAGSRIRLSIAGADADHYVHLPYGRPPLLGVARGGRMASTLELPCDEKGRHEGGTRSG
jgi:putative CocE/NonD family hydrolase